MQASSSSSSSSASASRYRPPTVESVPEAENSGRSAPSQSGGSSANDPVPKKKPSSEGHKAKAVPLPCSCLDELATYSQFTEPFNNHCDEIKRIEALRIFGPGYNLSDDARANFATFEDFEDFVNDNLNLKEKYRPIGPVQSYLRLRESSPDQAKILLDHFKAGGKMSPFTLARIEAGLPAAKVPGTKESPEIRARSKILNQEIAKAYDDRHKEICGEPSFWRKARKAFNRQAEDGILKEYFEDEEMEEDGSDEEDQSQWKGKGKA